MKQRKKRLVTLLLGLCVCLFSALFVSCGDGKKSTEDKYFLAVKGETVIHLGEFNYDDYTVAECLKSDPRYSQNHIKLSAEYMSAEDNAKLLTVGTHTVVVKVKNRTAEFTITILEPCEGTSGLEYRLIQSTDTYAVSAYTGEETDIVIPETYRGKAVTRVDSGRIFNDKITGITIPSGFTDMPSLGGCTALTEIRYNATDCKNSNEVSSIGANGEGITVKIGANVKTIPERLFAAESKEVAPKIKEVVFEEGSQCESIGTAAFTNCIYLENINIPETVNEIGNSAFSSCTVLKNINIPETVYKIGNSAFSSCTALKSINMPETVNEIGSSVFQYCSSLESVSMPSEITKIEQYLFYRCSSLKEIEIGENVTSIGSSAFEYCTSLEIIRYNANITNIDSYQYSVPFEDAGNGETTKVIVGAGVKQIPKLLFYQSKVAELAFEKNSQCEVIDINAFSYSSLISIDLPTGLKTIEGSAFYSCAQLETVVLPRTLTRIGSDAFAFCNELDEIFLPKELETVGEYAFNCESLTIYAEHDETETGYPDGWDSSWHSINPVVWNAYGVRGRTDDGFLWYKYSETADFVMITGYAGENATATIPSKIDGVTVTTICDYAFYRCVKLVDLTIPRTVEYIGGYAFSACSLLTIYCDAESKPDGWSSSWNESRRPVYWDAWRFYDEEDGNRGVSSFGFVWVRRADGIAITDYIGDETEVEILPYVDNAVNGHVVDGEVVEICAGVFRNREDIRGIVIPDTVKRVAANMCYKCSPVFYCAVESQPKGWGNFWSNGRIVWDYAYRHGVTEDGFEWAVNATDYTATIVGYVGTEKDIVIPEEVRGYDVDAILANALRGNKTVRSLVIGDHIKQIGENAFYSCSVTTVTIGTGVESIGGSAFFDSGYYNQTSNWENGILYVGNYLVATKKDEVKGEIVLKEGTVGIADRAFLSQLGLTRVEIPNSVQWIGERALYSCYSLESIRIGSGVKSIGSLAIYGFSLSLIEVDENNTAYRSIDGHLYTKDGKTFVQYARGNRAESFVLPSTVTKIADYAFYSCSTLKSITLSEGLVEIGKEAFYGLLFVNSYIIPESVQYIGENAFESTQRKTIYCKAKEQPSGWDENWNTTNNVTWGYVEPTE